MAATATLTCPEGCFEVRYSAGIDTPEVDDRDFLNELGVPTKVARGDSTCPNCGTTVTVDWGNSDD